MYNSTHLRVQPSNAHPKATDTGLYAKCTVPFAQTGCGYGAGSAAEWKDGFENCSGAAKRGMTAVCAGGSIAVTRALAAAKAIAATFVPTVRLWPLATNHNKYNLYAFYA